VSPIITRISYYVGAIQGSGIDFSNWMKERKQWKDLKCNIKHLSDSKLEHSELSD